MRTAGIDCKLNDWLFPYAFWMIGVLKHTPRFLRHRLAWVSRDDRKWIARRHTCIEVKEGIDPVEILATTLVGVRENTIEP